MRVFKEENLTSKNTFQSWEIIVTHESRLYPPYKVQITPLLETSQFHKISNSKGAQVEDLSETRVTHL